MLGVGTIANRNRFHQQDEQRQPHRELGEDVVESYRETKLQAMPKEQIIHHILPIFSGSIGRGASAE